MNRPTSFPTDLFGKARSFFGREAEEKPAARTAAKPATSKKAMQAFHAVSVLPCPGACGAAREIEGKRFLSRQAPILPLKGCDKAACRCRYEHHEDRRKGPRRARDFGVAIAVWDNVDEEHRNNGKRGRRKDDR
jgi:hypothetical protein